MDPSASTISNDKAQIGCLPLDNRTSMQEERQIDGAANVTTNGVGGVAAKAIPNELLEVRSYGNHCYSVYFGKIYRCPVCYEICSIACFKIHVERHTVREPYACICCPVPHRTRTDLENHLLNRLILHCGNYSYKCLNCGHLFSGEQGIKLHIMYSHGYAVRSYNSSNLDIIMADTHILRDVGNQYDGENSSKPVLRQTAANGSCASSHPSDGHTLVQELPVLEFSQKATSDQNHVNICKSCPYEEIPLQPDQVGIDRLSELVWNKKDFGNQESNVKEDVSLINHTSPDYQIYRSGNLLAERRQPLDYVSFSCIICNLIFFYRMEIIFHLDEHKPEFDRYLLG